MTKVVINDIVNRPSAFLALLGLLSLGQGLFYMTVSGLTSVPCNPLMVLGLNALSTGITLIIIAKVCFKPANLGMTDRVNTETPAKDRFGADDRKKDGDPLKIHDTEDNRSIDSHHAEELRDKKPN
jgi:hypothetical protein